MPHVSCTVYHVLAPIANVDCELDEQEWRAAFFNIASSTSLGGKEADIENGATIPKGAAQTAGASPSAQPRSRYWISTLSPLHIAPPALSGAYSSLCPSPAASPAARLRPPDRPDQCARLAKLRLHFLIVGLPYSLAHLMRFRFQHNHSVSRFCPINSLHCQSSL